MEYIQENQLASSILLLIIGAVVTLLLTNLSKKTGILNYVIKTVKLGISANDQIFGDIRLNWKGHDVRNLYLCTIEIENITFRDYENLLFKVYTGNETSLLSQRTEIVSSPHIVYWDDAFANRMVVPKDNQATEIQINEYIHNREFKLPVFNRGQLIRLSFLATNPNDDNEPSVELSTPSKGIKLRRTKLPHIVLNPIFGVPIYTSLIYALVLSIFVVVFTSIWIKNVWLTATICMIFGLTGQVFGALIYKLKKLIANLVAG